MPLIPEEPPILESVPGPLAAAGATRAPQAARPVPVPGPRPAPRPAPPRATRQASPGRPGPARTVARAADKPTGGAGPQVQLLPAKDGTAIAAADGAVDVLLDSGRAPCDILVLTLGGTHPWAQHEMSFGEDAYWRQQDDAEDVFYAAVDAERAAKRPVAVLAVNGGSRQDAASALPAAMARAGELLIVCGDPERLRALL